jgi:dipeptidyl aminopeptidase/acylaminoacyl peptidase
LALGRQEVVQYAARDGESIEGVLLYPTNFDANRRYPLIIAAHDGPGHSVCNGWITGFCEPGQVAAGHGFFVFYPNYRGSCGRGAPFAHAHLSDYGGKELNDIIDGIDHLANLGLIDLAKVGIVGHGYGGFAAAWCCTLHSDRFAAGVSLSGFSDFVSLSGSSDISETMFRLHSQKRLWQDWQFFLERSPMRYIEKSHTPLLLAHGKADRHVPHLQSVELFRQLKTLGNAPVRLILYPDEGHALVHSAAQYDFNRRMLRWFQHFLVLGEEGLPPLRGPTAARNSSGVR